MMMVKSMSSPILVFTFSGLNQSIAKGIQASKNIVFHALRIKFNPKTTSFIDPKRTINNQVFFNLKDST